MPKKEEEPLLKESPLQTAVKEGDEFKKEVDGFVKECQDVLKDTDLEKSAIAVKNLYKKSKDLLEDHGRLLRQAEDLKKENEPSKVMRFDSKKKDEIKRLEKQKEKIDKLNKQLEPDEVEEEYLSKVSKGAEVEESEESEEEESEEEESEEEESEEEAPQPKPSTSKQKVVQKTQEEDDEDLETEDDEEDEDDEEEDEESEEETDEEESEEEEEENTQGAVQHDQTMRQFVALQDYDAQVDGDLGFSAGDILTITNARDDGWLEAKDTEGNTGLVPSNFLKVYSQFEAQQDDEEELSDDEETDPKTPRRIPQRRKTSVTDVLHAMGSLPAGFREATLGKMATQDTYSMKNYLAPKLSPSCVSFRDLFFDAATNKIRARSVRVQRIVTVMVCRQIPLPGAAAGVEVLSRHLRACLFDGKNVLSNIHTIRIQGLDKTQTTWNFNTKATETMKTLEFADFFIRTNSSEGNIGILFELGMTYIRTSTGQEGEFSCGWVHMPLFDTNGAPAQNKTYDLFVNGGTPYEKGVDVDPSVGRRDSVQPLGLSASTNLFRSLMSGNRQPRLNIRIQAPTKDQKDLLDTLPDVCVSSTAYIQYLSFYRQILTDAVIRDCVEPRSTDLIHNPLLASFPCIADQPDLMDVLRVSWAERLKTAKRSEKKDTEALKQLYIKLFMDTVFPLVHAASIPALTFGDTKVEEERLKEIQRLQRLRQIKKTAGLLLCADASYTPFDTCEMAFNVLGPHCVSRQ